MCVVGGCVGVCADVADGVGVVVGGVDVHGCDDGAGCVVVGGTVVADVANVDDCVGGGDDGDVAVVGGVCIVDKLRF